MARRHITPHKASKLVLDYMKRKGIPHQVRRPARGWAAVHRDRPRGEPNIWHVAYRAHEVRQSMGLAFNPKDATAGWQQALKNGWRVVKVLVTVEESGK